MFSRDANTLILSGAEARTSSCLGDSGGPLVMNQADSDLKVLIGISSYVTGSTGPCRSVSVMTNVQGYLDWIQSHLNESL